MAYSIAKDHKFRKTGIVYLDLVLRAICYRRSIAQVVVQLLPSTFQENQATKSYWVHTNYRFCVRSVLQKKLLVRPQIRNRPTFKQRTSAKVVEACEGTDQATGKANHLLRATTYPVSFCPFVENQSCRSPSIVGGIANDRWSLSFTSGGSGLLLTNYTTCN